MSTVQIAVVPDCGRVVLTAAQMAELEQRSRFVEAVQEFLDSRSSLDALTAAIERGYEVRHLACDCGVDPEIVEAYLRVKIEQREAVAAA